VDDGDRQALAAVRVGRRQPAAPPPGMRPVRYDITGPDLPKACRAAAGCKRRHAATAGPALAAASAPAALAPPDPPHPPGLHPPASGAQQRGDPPIAGAAIPSRQGPDRLGQRRLILPDAALGA
jgi:hypothetical protein